jgi:zinc D-Ala-D-Ala dipeptidase
LAPGRSGASGACPVTLFTSLLRTLLIALALAATLTAAPAHAGPLSRAGLVDVRTHAREIRLDIRYATDDNFTGSRLPGYCKPIAVIRRPAARALARVQQRLARQDLGLLVYDAYRPARATRAMVRWAERTGNEWVISQGYVARRSNHNRGAAVDLTLVEAETGKPLGMGTRYDAFTTRSHTANATGAARTNRLTLKSAMEAFGFRNYRREWWHYDFPSAAGPPRDIPLGC